MTERRVSVDAALSTGAGARVQAVIESLRCDGTKGGRHEWRPGQWDDAREKLWCCRCARNATDIIDAALAALDAPPKGETPL
jgi:hypothetical protein